MRLSYDLDARFGMSHDTVSYATEEQSFEARESARANEDGICRDSFGFGVDLMRGMSDGHCGRDFESLLHFVFERMERALDVRLLHFLVLAKIVANEPKVLGCRENADIDHGYDMQVGAVRPGSFEQVVDG